ncbi:M20 family metallopeptidase [Curvibacter sp. RS43]|uniref:M20 aminoacylase family protein n=1 Tax=Curvibacter microcysteis TaxID=3026419 RepID=UPI00235FB1B0|nr:M20 aminoacylase family protein [Curvibacter sp. RS43]MDD0810800.1 M20 family metallopeptidase [Curvibacter sp. RS43]
MSDISIQNVLAQSQASAAEFVAFRRDIHQHPELGFQEHRTSERVAEHLQSYGYSVERGMGGTGVVAQLRRGTGPRRLGLRADMDALPIVEATGVPHASQHHGVMHACGHDGHTAMLLAAARQLAEQGEFDGTLNLIFQPAEEGLGGALKMMEDGLFDRYPCDAIFAMHNMPGYPQGHLALREGAAMASSDQVVITVRGVGGHGAMPHKAADPVVAASSLVMALQTVVSRNVDPLAMAVVTVGAFHAGEANNVIPDCATLKLSVRALDRGVRQLLRERITDLAQAQARSFGCEATVDYKAGYAVLVNTPAETALAREVALALNGPDRVTLQAPALPGSEDFAFMLEKVPGSYLLIGNGDGQDDSPFAGHSACMVHNPNYDFHDSNVARGAAYWVLLTQHFLRSI